MSHVSMLMNNADWLICVTEQPGNEYNKSGYFGYPLDVLSLGLILLSSFLGQFPFLGMSSRISSNSSHTIFHFGNLSRKNVSFFPQWFLKERRKKKSWFGLAWILYVALNHKSTHIKMGSCVPFPPDPQSSEDEVTPPEPQELRGEEALTPVDKN